MSNHAAFRRQPVPQQYAQNLALTTIPAPTRGIIQHENDAFMGPGAAIVQDNWFPTMKGSKLRGGCQRWCTLPETTAVISGFEYVTGIASKMFAANAAKLYDITTNTPALIVSGRTSGNYAASQITNVAGTQFLLAVNETGDPVLRFNGTSWVTLDPATIAAWVNNTAYAIGALAKDTTDSSYWRCLVAHTSAAAGTFAADRTAHPTFWASTASDGVSWITGPAGTPVEFGHNLSYVGKYRNRLFFIGTKSMSLWYLPVLSVGGVLTEIPLSGSFTKGGFLKFLASWTIDAGDGVDDKLVIMSSEGEVVIFTGSNPAATDGSWHQEGRFDLSPPLGMNAWCQVGGDLLLLTVSGIIPTSQAITKSAGELELAMITRSIKRMWRDEVDAKRQYAWTMKKWDEYGGNFITLPGGAPGARVCLAQNNATGAFGRALGWDAMCFMRLGADMFFGTQDGKIMQADRTGYDDGVPYVATLVGGWETLQSGGSEAVWHQARAIFAAPNGQPFVPQIAATTDYIVTIPPPPPAGVDPGVQDLWDQGLWDVAKWDAGVAPKPVNQNTMWVSIGMTGFTHAPIVQVTVAQQAKPDVELIAIAATYERAGVNV